MDRSAAVKLWREVAKGAPDGVASGRTIEEFANAVEASLASAYKLRRELMTAQSEEILHKLRVAEITLERLVQRCESDMADTIDVPEIQVARALLGLGA